MPQVLNKHTDVIPPGAISIMRPGRWGNRFVIGRDGDRSEVIEKHRQWLWNEIRTGHISLEELAALDEKALVCCCVPKACHGHTLVRAAVWARERIAFLAARTTQDLPHDC